MALSIMPTTGVSASATSASGQRDLYGSCKTGKYRGTARAFYTPSNGYDTIHEIVYYLSDNPISGGPGDKSNVRLRIREILSNRPDRSLWTWISGDNVKSGYHRKYPNKKVKYSITWDIEFSFTFDVPGLDPSCSGDTNNA
ncbi:hypothetical protein ETD86_54615 [Nonomuraea turkmeniaca]|uniref:Uncharacterized protein n=1 Tax=Nonomuraea turkmeniaca TaxID=103838 RepID=A0A5S4EUE1_9ACTN|nr:hypothetical protein [Nonomuraea turkmeniaca]TMR00781.1 hypothetical protein ETD86_54615 [Nonomuraea turkmeniaca]